jgi:hypothetical protein
MKENYTPQRLQWLWIKQFCLMLAADMNNTTTLGTKVRAVPMLVNSHPPQRTRPLPQPL